MSAGSELQTVGPATENVRRANSVYGQQRSAGRAHRSGRRRDGQHVMSLPTADLLALPQLLCLGAAVNVRGVVWGGTAAKDEF